MPARPRTNRTPDGAKRRWTPEERAHRASARTGRPADSDRRDAGRSQEDGTGQRDRRVDWYPGPRNGRSDAGSRFRRDDRPARDRDESRGARGDARSARDDRRPSRADQPRRTFRDDRPRRDDASGRVGRFDRDERSSRSDRAPRDDRFSRDDRPRGGRPVREDRPTREDRPARNDRFGREDRPARDDRFSRDDRSGRDDRPARGDRSERDARPARGDRDDRPRREDRFGRDDRPRRDDRPFRGDDRRRDDRQGSDARLARDRGDRHQDGRRSARDEQAPHWAAPDDVVLERLEGEVVTAEEVAGASFADLGLGQQITKALADLGATTPFPIQAATIPAALEGRNVLGRGRTGSGKTIAFGAALVERLMRNWAEQGRTGTGRRMGRAPRALVLAPTRELALQIDRTVQPIARAVGLYTTQIVGGVPQARQVGALAKGVDIVIGTPGRIEDLLEQRRLDLSEIEITVLDEADHMADLGFLEPMQRLLRRVPERGQRMLFSATLDAAVAELVDEFLPDPAVHEVADPEGGGTADHRVLVIAQGEKLPVLTALVAAADRSLVFARTRAFAEQLADDLDGEGVRAESLHGDLNQARRTRNLARFSEGRVAALVATDVAARGIHVDGIDLVVHADSAEDYKTYLHRSGRTGRAGASGTVVTLITERRRRRFTELLGRAGVEAQFTVLRPGDDPVAAVGR